MPSPSPALLRPALLAAFALLLPVMALAPAAAGAGALDVAPAETAKSRAAGAPADLAGTLVGPLLELALGAARLDSASTPAAAGATNRAAGTKRLADAIATGALRIDERGAVQVEASIVGAGPDSAALTRLGVHVEVLRADLGRAQYRVPIAALAELARLEGVLALRPPTYARIAAGTVTSEGDAALRAELARDLLGLSGAGVRVGVISDGVAGLAAAIASGDAPTPEVQRAFNSGGLLAGSEGTAMIEIVHDLAPGAGILFASVSTFLEMMEAVDFLAERADIVVDDLGFLFPDDQQSDLSVNTAAALNNPDWRIRGYFTAAGNSATRHYQDPYTTGPDGSTLGLPFAGAVHEFRATARTVDTLAKGSKPYNEIFLGAGESVVVTLYWDDPWTGSGNDYDLYLLDGDNRVVAESGASQAGSPSHQPREQLEYVNAGEPGLFRIVVQNFEDRAATRELEIFVFDNAPLPGASTVLNFNTAASSLLAQSDAGGGVITVGAVGVAAAELSSIRPYSGRGPTNNGALKPDAVAVDGVTVTGSGGFPTPFFGTSAAAPHAAALAALVLEAHPSLLAADGGEPAGERTLLRALLTGSAQDLGVAGADTVYGFGRVDAVFALAEAPAVTVRVETEADAGVGSLRAAIAALNLAAAEGASSGAIEFGEGPIAIRPATALPALTVPNVAIDATSLLQDGRPGVVIDGGAIGPEGVAVPGLVVRSAGVTIAGIEVRNFSGPGLHLEGASAVRLRDLRLDGNATGLRVDGGAVDVQVGDESAAGLVAVHNLEDGVLISGASTENVRITRSRIGIEADGTPAGNGGAGIRIAEGAANHVIGAAPPPQQAPLASAQASPLSHVFQGSVVIDGLPAPAGTVVEALLDGVIVAAVALGVVEIDGGPGFVLSVSGSGDSVTFRIGGVLAAQRFAFQPGGLTTVALSVSATPVGGNVIAHNAGSGVRIEGESTGGISLRGNLIHSNGRLAIDLVSPTDPPGGVTPADPAGGAAGPNGLLNAPHLDSVTFQAGLARISGSATAGTLVDLYAAVDPGTDPDVERDSQGTGGAVRHLATVHTDGGQFRAENVAVGSATEVTALATDAAGNTSEFALNLVLEPAPSILEVSPSSGSTEGDGLATISGSGFGAAGTVQVFFGAAAATVEAQSATQLTVRTPPGEAGFVAVRVVNAGGRESRLESAYEYRAVRVVVLQPGWNNVIWRGPALPVTAGLESLAGVVDRVFAWDAELQRYRLFAAGVPAAVNTLHTLEPNQALWLFVSAPGPVLWEQPLAD